MKNVGKRGVEWRDLARMLSGNFTAGFRCLNNDGLPDAKANKGHGSFINHQVLVSRDGDIGAQPA